MLTKTNILRKRFAIRRLLAPALLLAFCFIAPSAVLAQVQNASDATIAPALGLGTNTDLRLVVINVVRYLLGFLGLLAVIIVLYGGYLWMTSAGNTQRVDQAKQVLKNGLIGLVIILSAYGIVSFILFRYFQQDDPNFNALRFDSNPPCLNCWSLGAGIVEDHYPGRDANDIPRNVTVLISFREKIKVLADADADEQNDSFILNAVPQGQLYSYEQNGSTVTRPCGVAWCGELNPSVFSLLWQNNVNGPVEAAAVVYTNDQQTFGIAPVALLGSPDTEARYQALVKGKPADNGPGLTRDDQADGKAAMDSDYAWDFEVSTKIDTTPPVITDIVPYDQDTTPRSSAVLVTFSEALNPMSATGDTTSGFGNIVIANHTADAANGAVDNNPVGTVVPGKYRLGNGYRTVIFLTDTPCPTPNACGEQMFCFEGNGYFRATVKAATLWSTSAPCSAPIADPTNNKARACSPIGGLVFDGVVDAAGNSLDGTRNSGTLKLPTGNDKAEGSPVDNFVWDFRTDDTIVNTGPEIVDTTESGAVGVTPVPDAPAVDKSEPLSAQFNRAMLPLVAFPDPLNSKAKKIPPVKIYSVDALTNEVFGLPVGPVWTRQDRVKVCSLQPTRTCSLNNDCGRCEAGGADCSPASPCANGSRCAVGVNFCGQESARIHHSTFADSQAYEARIGNGLKDFTQNCFEPPVGPVPNSLCAGNDKNNCPSAEY